MDEETAPKLDDCATDSPQEQCAVDSGNLTQAIIGVARLHRVLAGTLLRKVGLHPSQELVMMRLWVEGPQRQADLAKMLGTDSATMTRTVQRLEAGGFVRRVPCEHDRRATIVEATPASLGAREDVEASWRELEDCVTRGLSEEELASMLSLLGKMQCSLAEAIAKSREFTD